LTFHHAYANIDTVVNHTNITKNKKENYEAKANYRTVH